MAGETKFAMPRLRSDEAAGTIRDPAKLAPFIAYLASERAAHITGQSFAVVGNQVTHLRERIFGTTIRCSEDWEEDALAKAVDSDLVPHLTLQPYNWPPD